MRHVYNWLTNSRFGMSRHRASMPIRKQIVAWASAVALFSGLFAAGTSTLTDAEAAKPTSSASQSDKGNNGNAYGKNKGNTSTSEETPAEEDTVDTVTDEGTTEEPATEAPAEEPTTEEPATEAPATEEPVTEAPATEEPATEEPAGSTDAGTDTAGGAWPDASNTGVPAGVSVKPYTGSHNITTPGTVLDGYEFNGTVYIQAPNVTIKNSIVHGRIDTGDANRYGGTVIQRTEIIGPYNSAADGGYPAIGYTGFTADGVEVRGWGKGFGLVRDVTVKNSWVHDIVVHGDPANGGSHNETIISLGGSNFTIVNNRLDAGNAPNVSASIALYSQMEAISNVLVQDNLLDGGGYCMYAGLAGSHGSSDSKFLNNTFGNKYSDKCGSYGPAIAYDPNNGNQWSGNVLQSTGSLVGTPGRG
jgi:hypothetical protein